MATRRFDSFVLFAEMRTGSNHLEESLNTLPDVVCHGEVFNPVFLGQHNRFELFGFDMARREADPFGLLEAIMAQSDGLPGFRLFHDHDARVIERVLPDPRIAKIILTRNPLDSYVSRKIASETGQWRLTDARHQKTARIRFDADEFAAQIAQQTAFQAQLQRGLQLTGQAAFHLRYEDINDAAILNGLATFLGSQGQIAATPSRLKKQNPDDLSQKVENYDEMLIALRDLDRFGLSHIPEFEPQRPAGVPGFVAHPKAGLLFLPITAAPTDPVLDWMGAIDGVGRDALLRKMTQKDLRQWMKDHHGYRSFTVLRHPVARAYQSFCQHILPADQPNYEDLRRILRNRYQLPIPAKTPGPRWTEAQQKAAFLAFLGFLKPNLAGQTSMRIDTAWATQSAILQGMANVTIPHRLIREETMQTALADLAREVGVIDPPQITGAVYHHRIALDAIYDHRIEKAAYDAYRRDYLNLGFSSWASG